MSNEIKIVMIGRPESAYNQIALMEKEFERALAVSPYPPPASYLKPLSSAFAAQFMARMLGCSALVTTKKLENSIYEHVWTPLSRASQHERVLTEIAYWKMLGKLAPKKLRRRIGRYIRRLNWRLN